MDEFFEHMAISLDTVFGVLADQRRRSLLRCLNEYENTMALADVADEIATREREKPITELSAEEVKTVYISLYHEHIPKMVDAGVVRYNQEKDMVMLVEDTETWRMVKELLTAV